ncbi:MAG: PepSY-associated TM helix domain-containing protein [Shewanella algae]
MQIRSDILRIYQTLHTWVGILAGILLFIGFYAGALTMFKEEIAAWSSPPQTILPQVKLEQMDKLLSEARAQHPELSKGFSLHLASDKHSPLSWYASGSERQWGLGDELWHASLSNQGELISHKEPKSQLARLIDELHRTGGIPGDMGHEQLGAYFMGVAGILYFLALVSGVIFLLPTLVKTLFALRRKKGPNRFWLDSHNLLGITALPFHIIISLTVVVFVFHDQLYGALGQFVYGDKPMFNREAPKGEVRSLSTLPPVTELVARAESFAPGYQALSLTYMGMDTPAPMVRMAMYNEEALMRGPIGDFLYMNPYTLEVGNSTFTPGEEGVWGRMVSVFFGLHFGSYGGYPGRWLYFFLGMSGAMLFYSGNLLWLEKRRSKQRKGEPIPEQPRRVRILGAATVGICLGSMLGVALAMLLGKWGYAHVENINHLYLWSYYASFLIALAYAFWRGAARAAVTLQALSALVCLAMPLTSILALLAPGLGIWAPETPGTWAVDLTAFGFAAIFAFGALKTFKRATQGPADSIWAMPQKQPIAALQTSVQS